MRIRQLIRKPRKAKLKKSGFIQKKPQVKALCLRVFTMSPRKPNSAIRKVVRVKLSYGKIILAYIPGEGHSLQEHANILVRGGKTKDLPGVKLKVIRGCLDALGVIGRKTSRSKYGSKK